MIDPARPLDNFREFGFNGGFNALVCTPAGDRIRDVIHLRIRHAVANDKNVIDGRTLELMYSSARLTAALPMQRDLHRSTAPRREK